MKELFFQLIHDYKEDVKKAIILLNEKNIRSPYFFRKSRVGYLDDKQTIKYSFHGFGCYVDFGNGEEVDFDYGVFDGSGRVDGFHKWTLENYISGNEKNKTKYQAFNSYKDLYKMFDTMIENGEIIKDPRQELYYLPEDLKNPNPIRWNPRPPRRKR